MLPPDTLLMVEGRSWDRVLEVVDIPGIRTASPNFSKMIEGGLHKLLTIEPFAPGGLTAIGLDPHAPVGFALLRPDGDTLGFYAGIDDRVLLRSSIVSIAARAGVNFKPTLLGAAEVFADPRGMTSIILRDKVVCVVFQQPSTKDAPRYAEIMATLPPVQSLANNRPFRKASAGMVDSDVLAYSNPALWVARAQDNASPGGAVAELNELLFGSIEALAIRLDVRKSGLMVEGRLISPPEGFARRLLTPRKGDSPLLRSLNGEPLLAISARTDPALLLKLFDKLLRADGSDWTSIADKAKTKFDIDLNAELRARLTGGLGVALTMDVPWTQAKGRPDFPREGGVSVHLQVTDPEGLRTVLDRVVKAAKKHDRGSRAVKRAGANWMLAVEGRKVYLGVHGDQLVLSTDPEFGVRLATTAPGDLLERTTPAGAAAVMRLADAAASLVVDAGRLAAAKEGDVSSTVSLRSRPPGKPPRALRKQYKRLNALEAKLGRLEAEERRARVNARGEILNTYGTAAVVIRADDEGLTFRGGQFFRDGSLASMLAATLRAADSGHPLLQGEAFKERQRLEGEARTLRAAIEAEQRIK